MTFTPAPSDLRTKQALKDIIAERVRQEELWGVQTHEFGACIGLEESSIFRQDRRLAESSAKDIVEKAVERGDLTWMDILREEYCEAGAATSIEELREELIQVAAVACAIVEDIDSRVQVDNPVWKGVHRLCVNPKTCYGMETCPRERKCY